MTRNGGRSSIPQFYLKLALDKSEPLATPIDTRSASTDNGTRVLPRLALPHGLAGGTIPTMAGTTVPFGCWS